MDILTQAAEPNGKVRQIVESFFATSENLNKIIESLPSNFGTKDLQFEVYIRELLKLVSNKFSNCKDNYGYLKLLLQLLSMLHEKSVNVKSVFYDSSIVNV